MTDHKTKGAPAPENSEKSREDVQEPQGAGITVSGISGTKTLRVGRVNKRHKDATVSSDEKPDGDITSAQMNQKSDSSSAFLSHDESKLHAEHPMSSESNMDLHDAPLPKSVEHTSGSAESVHTRSGESAAAASGSDSATSHTTLESVRKTAEDQTSTADVASKSTDRNDDGKAVTRTASSVTSPDRTQAGPQGRSEDMNGYTPRSSGTSGYQGNRPLGQGGYQGNRPAGEGGYQGNRPLGQGGYQGNRPAGESGYQGNRPLGQGGYQGNRPAGEGGYQGNRPLGQGGYQGNRPAGEGGYQGNRPMGQGGYQGNRPAGEGGYQGNRPMGQGGYQGNRPAGDGGYSSQRPPQSGFGGPAGSRPQGGFGAGRPPQGGFGGNRPREDSFGKAKDENFVRSKEDNGYGSRGQARGPAKPHSDIPVEISKEKANFAARDAYEKSRKEPSKEVKKEVGKPGSVQTDRRVGNKNAVTAVFSGRGASEILSDETVLDNLYSADGKGKRSSRKKPFMAPMPPPPKAVLSFVQLPEFITIKDFSEGIQKRSTDVIKRLMKLGLLATINQEIDFDTATLIASEYGITTEKVVEVTEEDILFDDTVDNDEALQTRPPVVVVMGHVDHGKTSLLDKIRSASVVKGEAGGITQHIGAYTVKLKGRQITFLDTPGHEAFTTMRARGAQVTDIAILVVAADDGVMPQTIEAIHHAKAANTEIVVAINKIDKPGSNPEKVKLELSQHGVIAEEWGGSNVMVNVSAKTGEGIDDLLEMVLLTADVMDLKADPHRQAKGTVIEAKLDKNRGPVATVLVQRGTLRAGDTLVTGAIIGRVRAMTDDKGASVKKAGPSIPVEILGLPDVPDAGELFYAVTDDKVARQLAEKRRVKQREDQLRKSSRMSLETLAQNLAAGETKDLNLIVKADVQGSVEAIVQSLEKLSSGEIHVRVIHGAVGAITESDVVLADVSNAIIIGFNVRPGSNIAEKAKNIGVDIKLYRVIYSAIEDVEAAMKGMLKPTYEEAILGHIEIRQIFKVSNIGTVGGAYVTDGKVLRSSEVRIVRAGIVVHEGKLASLKRFKDDAKEVATGYECGISIENFNDIREGDIVEAFEMREIARK
jgi:translation initiation factor IF-2